MIMHEEKIALVRQQIAAVRAAAEKREIRDIYVAACGGSLATLYPVKYILERETDAVTVSAVNAAEFYNDPPRRLGEHGGDRGRRPAGPGAGRPHRRLHHGPRLRHGADRGLPHLLL